MTDGNMTDKLDRNVSSILATVVILGAFLAVCLGKMTTDELKDLVLISLNVVGWHRALSPGGGQAPLPVLLGALLLGSCA